MDKQLKKDYEALCQLFGVKSSLWSQIHCHYTNWVCWPSIIAEYFLWSDFVCRAKEAGFPYYINIDTFLEEYKDAVESRVRL